MLGYFFFPRNKQIVDSWIGSIHYTTKNNILWGKEIFFIFKPILFNAKK